MLKTRAGHLGGWFPAAASPLHFGIKTCFPFLSGFASDIWGIKKINLNQKIMKSFVVLSLFLGGALAGSSRDIPATKVPPVVKEALMAKFPQALDLEWEKTKDLFEADFEIAQVDYSVLLDASGKIIMDKKDLSSTELPASITAAIARDFSGFTVEDAEKIEKSGETLFQVELKKGKQEVKRVFAADGTLSTTVSFWD
ncbi:MAG: PepSY-like domain-containing protein [Adhaeribacter sp.]